MGMGARRRWLGWRLGLAAGLLLLRPPDLWGAPACPAAPHGARSRRPFPRQVGKHVDALRLALKLDREDLIHGTFNACVDPLEKQQLCYLLARQSRHLNLEEGPCAVADSDARQQLQDIVNNTR